MPSLSFSSTYFNHHEVPVRHISAIPIPVFASFSFFGELPRVNSASYGVKLRNPLARHFGVVMCGHFLSGAAAAISLSRTAGGIPNVHRRYSIQQIYLEVGCISLWCSARWRKSLFEGICSKRGTSRPQKRHEGKTEWRRGGASWLFWWRRRLNLSPRLDTGLAPSSSFDSTLTLSSVAQWGRRP